MAAPKTILFAGGGTGGHIFPNLAVLERLREAMGDDVRGHFLVSDRLVDATILETAGESYTALPAQPFSRQPVRLWQCVRACRQSVMQVNDLITQTRAAAMVSSGGFVTPPALYASRRAGLPAALVNLDAVPGLASRAAARWATDLFTAYRTEKLQSAQPIGLPLRRSALASCSPEEARRLLGLSTQRPTLLVTAGSQGARSINRTLAELCRRPGIREALKAPDAESDAWQVLHLAGNNERDELALAYEAAEVPAVVLTFCQEMGLAWAAADLAISRAGAGSVAEAWANGVPTIFMPYPHHRDQHQRLNAAPLVERGGALLITDHSEPTRNAAVLVEPLTELLTRPEQLQVMRDRLGQPPADGAEIVAAWVRLAIGAVDLQDEQDERDEHQAAAAPATRQAPAPGDR